MKDGFTPEDQEADSKQSYDMMLVNAVMLGLN